jgi:transposase
VIVRDGYAGYGHLTSALHAWCGVHLLRDLKGLYDFEPSQQQWVSQMAALLIQARDAAAAARLASQPILDAVVLNDLMLTAPGPPEPAAAPSPGQLSAREQELVTLVAQGRTDAQIASQLHISVRTVSSHLDRIRDKTGCRRRTDLTRLALSTGLV